MTVYYADDAVTILHGDLRDELGVETVDCIVTSPPYNTTLRAAKDRGRKAIGVDISEAYCRRAMERCAQEVLFA